MRKAITIALMLMVVSAYAFTTYIPTYRSYLHILTGNDTIAVANNLDTLELVDPEGMFTLRIDQEDVTKEKVKAIKRAKSAAGWAAFSAAVSGVSTAFSDNSLEYYVRRENTRIATYIAGFYSANASVEQTLKIDLWIDNTSSGELMVCDMERGLVWWIMPKQSRKRRLNNPDLTCLRISDPQNHHVRYAAAMAGNTVKKWEIELETDEYWYSPVYREQNEFHDASNLMHYIRISKLDYSETKLKKEDFYAIKKAEKKAKK